MDISKATEYRFRRNRNRVLAMQYTGDNKQDILDFIERKNTSPADSEEIKCDNKIISPEDFVVRIYRKIGDGRKELSLIYNIYNPEQFNKYYKMSAWEKEARNRRDNQEIGESERGEEKNIDKRYIAGMQEERDKSSPVLCGNFPKRFVGSSEIEVVSFKSFPKMFKKEVTDLKNNTVRKKDKSERFLILDDFALRRKKKLQIEIVNTDTKESFIRNVRDVSCYEDMYIITWYPERKNRQRRINK